MYLLLIAIALSNLFYLALHVASSGSFPSPLSAREERECLEKIRQGDQAAKNKLIEHNLRLVAHIIKRIYNKSRPAPANNQHTCLYSYSGQALVNLEEGYPRRI